MVQKSMGFGLKNVFITDIATHKTSQISNCPIQVGSRQSSLSGKKKRKEKALGQYRRAFFFLFFVELTVQNKTKVDLLQHFAEG